jgi:RNA polymerase sigma-70 factor, ECF subfamily
LERNKKFFSLIGRLTGTTIFIGEFKYTRGGIGVSIINSFFNRSKASTFEVLIKQEQGKLYKVAYSYVKNEQDALDIVQEAIIKGYESFHKLKDSQLFMTWMTRIVINSAIDYIRKSKDVIVLETDWFDPGINQENKSVMELDVATVFDKLKPEQKTLLLLRFYYGYSISEIAEILEKPEGTIKSKLHRTLNQVKEKLGKGGETYGELSTRY